MEDPFSLGQPEPEYLPAPAPEGGNHSARPPGQAKRSTTGIGDRLQVEIDSRQALKSRALHAYGKTAATTEEIDKAQWLFCWVVRREVVEIMLRHVAHPNPHQVGNPADKTASIYHDSRQLLWSRLKGRFCSNYPLPAHLRSIGRSFIFPAAANQIFHLTGKTVFFS
jgi:hypothetical protein